MDQGLYPKNPKMSPNPKPKRAPASKKGSKSWTSAAALRERGGRQQPSHRPDWSSLLSGLSDLFPKREPGLRKRKPRNTCLDQCGLNPEHVLSHHLESSNIPPSKPEDLLRGHAMPPAASEPWPSAPRVGSSTRANRSPRSRRRSPMTLSAGLRLSDKGNRGHNGK